MVYWLDVLFLLVKAISLLLGSFCLIRFTLKEMVYLLKGFVSRKNTKKKLDRERRKK